MSSGLSAEQQRRIEENRTRAREKLAFRHQQQSETGTSTHSQHQHSLSTQPAPATSSTAPRAREGSGGCFTGRPECSLTVKPTATADSKLAIRTRQTSAPVATGNKSIKYTELVRLTVKANLTLVSKQRFEIVIPYDKLAIEVFKKTPTNMYSKSLAQLYTVHVAIHTFRGACTLYVIQCVSCVVCRC